MPNHKAPYWRLSSLYFFYFTVVGIVLPYWGLYLAHLGFSPVQIGLIVSIPMATKMIAPNVWGWLADRSGHYLRVIRLGALCAVVFFCGVVWRTDYVGLLCFTVLFTFFWNAILPQFEVLTLDALGENAHHYSRVRLWGSIGFIFSVVALGWFFERVGVDVLPWVMWLFLLLIAAVTWVLPNQSPHKTGAQTSQFLSVFKRSPVMCFFIASILLHLSHGVFYGFYSIHLEEHQYSKTAIGLLWAIGVVAEIIVFIKVPSLFARFSLWHCYLWGVAAAAIRWLAVAFYADNALLMITAQLLHALTFGVTHAVAIEIVRQSFSSRDRGKAQAMYSALCFGAGGALGAYLSGLIWSFGGAFSFVFAALMAAFGFLVVWFGMSKFKVKTATI